MNPKKFYVTTPIYYPNAKPHVGTLYTSVIADVLARWNKLMGKDVFFLTGCDEHGQKIQQAAEKAGKNPQDFVDAITPLFEKVWKLYNIDYSHFLRTSATGHEEGVKQWIGKLIDQGDVYKSLYSGLYCTGCEAYVSSSNNEAVKDAQGNFLCPIHQTQLKEISEEGYFFRLSAYQDKLLEFYEQHPDFITPKERINEVVSFVQSGLKDLCISRKKESVSWAIPFPGDPDHTVYVWADALPNYLTGIGYGQGSKAQEKFNFWWPANVQVMAKDIVKFHAVYWPAFLMASEMPLPKKLLVHGYILVDDQKMSKSAGNACDPETLAEQYGVEPVRYFLMRQMAVTQDGNFATKDLEEHVNADLANNLGNLLSRVVALAINNGLTIVKAPATTLEIRSAALKERSEETYRFVWEEMNKNMIHIALGQLFKFVSEVNAFIHEMQPWILAKQNTDLFAEVISVACHCLAMVGILLWPVMPTKMEELLGSLGISLKIGTDYEQLLRENEWNKTFELKKRAVPLFTKIEKRPEETKVVASATQEQGQSTDIDITDFSKVILAVGTVLSCQPVPKSDKLYQLEVDLGQYGKRSILSGVAQYLKPEELIGIQGVFVVNLKPRPMMGLMSHGMMLFAPDADGKQKPLTVKNMVTPGSRVK